MFNSESGKVIDFGVKCEGRRSKQVCRFFRQRTVLTLAVCISQAGFPLPQYPASQPILATPGLLCITSRWPMLLLTTSVGGVA